MIETRKWFYITIAISVSLICIYMTLVAFLFRTPASTLWIDNCMKKKEAIANNVTGNKIVILGGSASLFGIRTQDIQRELKVPVVNMAVHVGLQTDYILFRIKRSLKPGDIIILPFEFELYSYDEIPSTVKLEYLFTHDRDYLFHNSHLTVMRYILSVTRDQIITSIREQHAVEYQEPPVEGAWTYTSLSLNKNGDETNNDTNKSFASFPLAMPVGEIKPRPGLKIIKEFSKWCNCNNVTLYVSYPNTVYHKEYEQPYYKYYFDILNNYFIQNNISVLGNPYMFFYEKGLFYDTYYHLNKKGMTTRTAQLIHIIRDLDSVKKMVIDHKNRSRKRYNLKSNMKTLQSRQDYAAISERLPL